MIFIILVCKFASDKTEDLTGKSTEKKFEDDDVNYAEHNTIEAQDGKTAATGSKGKFTVYIIAFFRELFIS